MNRADQLSYTCVVQDTGGGMHLIVVKGGLASSAATFARVDVAKRNQGHKHASLLPNLTCVLVVEGTPAIIEWNGLLLSRDDYEVTRKRAEARCTS